jgi:hypothetical protein
MQTASLITDVKLSNYGLQTVIRDSTLLAIGKRLSQSGEFVFIILKQAQSCSDYFTCRTIAAAVELLGNESVKMFAKTDAGIPSHNSTPHYIITNYWYIAIDLSSCLMADQPIKNPPLGGFLAYRPFRRAARRRARAFLMTLASAGINGRALSHDLPVSAGI